MNILFAFTIEDYLSNQNTINKIRRYLLSQGNNLTIDWVNVVENNLSKYTKFQMKRLFKKSIQALSESKIVILEASTPSFELTSIAYKAIDLKKPTLILKKKKEDFEAKEPDYITINNPDYIETKEYSDSSLEKIIDNFIKTNLNDPITRFNILLERKQKNYLDWADRFYRMSKSEIIRELINNKAENDPNYPQNKF
ncbi:MAG: hypothetical protein KatS3mg085_211 [Candidatus Dojkabacteria bacterium]|nr:MAG: hypothetical protein KatS3mg085_211 [Candidatus Dojkabacteria bacterium]